MSERDQHDFMGELARFREMAENAREAARSATSETMRREYRALAESWDQLIKEIESL